MGFSLLERPTPRLAVFGPPYDSFTDIDLGWRAPTVPARGLSLVWWLADGAAQEADFHWLHDRLQSLPLFVVLPPARHVTDALPLLNYVQALQPRAVLPTSRLVAPDYLRSLLAAPPENLGVAVTEYLARRDLLRDERLRREVRRIFDVAPEVSSISRLSKRLYTSRRTICRHFLDHGLPVPGHWLQFARLMHATVRLQNDPASVFRIVSSAGYPDGFAMSNQMKRLMNCRPSEVRQLLGWEWVVESWLSREALMGGIDLDRYGDVVGEYITTGKRPASNPAIDLQHA